MIVDLIDDAISGERREGVVAHIESCDWCRGLVVEVMGTAERTGEPADPDPRGEGREATGRQILPEGALVARYRIERLLGAGGMGIVYAAYDPELDRTVALKLIGPHLATGNAGARLRRESKALAKLSHPNVTAVHDVGVANDEIFIAIEYVGGETVRRWLDRRRRHWRDILDVFRKAGRGLAAAHAAGLVHRDFKPDNVLIADDGQVKVTDFGLAQMTGGPARGSTAPPIAASGRTQHGRVMGTPGYMAPEQFRHAPTDQRTDQFAFAASLYEALYGTRPFSGATLRELVDSMERDQPIPRPRAAGIPMWLHRAVARGLATDPADRFASMDDMLAALVGPRRARLAIAAAGLGTIALAIGIAIGALVSDRSSVCQRAGNGIHEVWNGGSRRKVAAAFAATGKPYSADVARSVSRHLDVYARSWSSARIEACKATYERADQSAELYDRQVICLDSRRQDVAELVALLSVADSEIVVKTVAAVSELGDLNECSNRELLMQLAPPRSAAQNAGVAQVRGDISRAKAWRIAGRHGDALEIAQRAVVRARPLGYRPVEAEALYELGRAQHSMLELADAETSMLEAAWVAEASRHDAVRADAWIRLIAISIDQRGVRDPSEWASDRSREFAREAAAAIERLGGDPRREALRLTFLGFADHVDGKYDAALARFGRAVDLFEAAGDGDSLDSVLALDGLATVHEARAEHDRALRIRQRALAIRRRESGEAHPTVARAQEAISGTGSGSSSKREDRQIVPR